MLEHKKILAPEYLVPKIDALRSLGKRIVFTNGCFDILHPGHVQLLEQARNLGDLLVLGLNTDNSVKSLGKGENRPINPLQVRAFVLAHLSSVDFITFFDESTPLKLIKAIAPDILVKGGDWSTDKIVGGDFVRQRGGQVFSIPLLPSYSTTQLIEKICQTTQPIK